MDRKPYIKYRITRRAIERLLGESRSSVSYHIRRLRAMGFIEDKMCDRTRVLRKENGRMFLREIDVFDIFALKTIAASFESVRAESVYNRCNEIIEKNKKGDYLHYRCQWID